MPNWIMPLATWLSTLTAQQASFLGSAIGSAVGLVALLLGALFNAHLNRLRDDRLRAADRKGTAVALRAELSAIRRSLSRNAEALRAAPPSKTHFTTPDLGRLVKVYPHVVGSVTGLRQATIELVIEAYGMIDEYSERLALSGGKIDTSLNGKAHIIMPSEGAEIVAAFNQRVVEIIDLAIAALGEEIG